MADHDRMNEAKRRDTVTVRVDPECSTHLRVGSRWEVVASSLDTLWEGSYTVTLREVERDPA